MDIGEINLIVALSYEIDEKLMINKGIYLEHTREIRKLTKKLRDKINKLTVQSGKEPRKKRKGFSKKTVDKFWNKA